MANPTNSLGSLLGTATARSGAPGGVAIIMGEGVVAEVGAVQITDKGRKKRIVTIALLGGGSREPQIIRAKLVDELTALGDGLEPYARVRFLATYAEFKIDNRNYSVMTVTELERVTSSPAHVTRPEVA